MKLHTIGEMKIDAKCRIAALRQMTAEQLLHLGMRQVVYLKGGMCGGKRLFILYGADGSPIARPDDVESAMEMVAEWVSTSPRSIDPPISVLAILKTARHSGLTDDQRDCADVAGVYLPS